MAESRSDLSERARITNKQRKATLHFHKFAHDVSKDRDVSSSLLSCMAESVHARMKTERPTGAYLTIPFCKAYLTILFCKQYHTILFSKLYSTISWMTMAGWEPIDQTWACTQEWRLKQQRPSGAKTLSCIIIPFCIPYNTTLFCMYRIIQYHVYRIIQYHSANHILQEHSAYYILQCHTEHLPHSEKIL